MTKMNRTVIALVLFCAAGISGQAQTITSASIKKIFANQPDFTADYSIVTGRELIKLRFAKKGASFRHEIMPVQNAVSPINEEHRYYKVVTLTFPDRPVVALDPQEKTYTELPADFKFQTPDLEYHFQAALRREGRVTGSDLGAELVDQHKARKIGIRFGGADAGTIYVASDLNDLIVKLEAKGEAQPISFSMSNISLQVPQELFEVPKDYQKIGFESFLAAMKRKIVK